MSTVPERLLPQGPADLGRLDPIELDFDIRVPLWDGKFEQSTWHMAAKILAPEDAEDENARETIFSMYGWMFPSGLGGELGDFLDEDADSAEFIPLTDEAGLRDEYDMGYGGHLVIVDRARLDPAWRGLGGVGRYLTGVGLLTLRNWADCIALHPAPIELTEKYGVGNEPKDEWDRETKRLTKVWRTLGFVQARGGNLVLDPTLNKLDNAVTRLGRNLGIRH